MMPDNVGGEDPLPPGPSHLDAVVTINGGGSFGRLMIEAKRSFGPRDVDALLGGINRTLRKLASAEILVIAPSLSARTRELLATSGINYLDLAGNVRIHLSSPAVFIERVTIPRTAPDRSTPATAGLRGPRAGRLVRALVDARGSWTVRQLADVADLSPGYVSKLLEALDQEAIVQRGRRGVVEQVDWPALLRSWAQAYQVLKSTSVRSFISRRGPSEVLGALVGSITPRWAVTGSYGAVALAPVAAPSVLMLYTAAPADLARLLDQHLLPADQGADVLLLEPADDVVFKRTWRNGGAPVVAAGQVAADCLTGPGRMPGEGEALMRWMQANEPLWRAPSPTEIDNAGVGLAAVAAQW